MGLRQWLLTQRKFVPREIRVLGRRDTLSLTDRDGLGNTGTFLEKYYKEARRYYEEHGKFEYQL